MTARSASLPSGGSRGHARAMDRLYRYQRYVYDLTRKYYLVGRDRLIAGLQVPESGSVLEVGCGTGRNLVLAAGRNPRARLFGLDISREMLLSAGAAARRAGVAERISTAVGDAASFDSGAAFGVAGFDRVIFSYSLSMIPDWRGALALALDQTSARGSLHLVDFGQMERWPGAARAAMRWWLTRFHVTPRVALIEAAEGLSREKGLEMTTTRIAGGYAWMIVISRPGTLISCDANRLIGTDES